MDGRRAKAMADDGRQVTLSAVSATGNSKAMSGHGAGGGWTHGRPRPPGLLPPRRSRSLIQESNAYSTSDSSIPCFPTSGNSMARVVVCRASRGRLQAWPMGAGRASSCGECIESQPRSTAHTHSASSAPPAAT